MSEDLLNRRAEIMKSITNAALRKKTCATPGDQDITTGGQMKYAKTGTKACVMLVAIMVRYMPFELNLDQMEPMNPTRKTAPNK